MLQAFNIYSNHNATRSCSCSAVAHRCQGYFWILSFRGELSCSKWLMHGRLPQDILLDAWDMRPHIDHIWICQYNALRCDAINLVNTPNVINNCVSETLVSAWVRPSALTQIVSKSQAPSFIWLRLATRPMQCSNVRSCFQDTRTQWQRFSPLFSHVLHAWSLVPVILWISAALRAAIQYRRLHNDHCDSNQCVALQPQKTLSRHKWLNDTHRNFDISSKNQAILKSTMLNTLKSTWSNQTRNVYVQQLMSPSFRTKNNDVAMFCIEKHNRSY